MIPLLEARRLSALFCGHKVKQTNYNTDRWYFFDRRGNILGEWTPDTNAEQMAECMEAVIDAGWDLNYRSSGCFINERSKYVCINVTLRECAMYAAAELQRRKG